jgi:diketogulonate reductase-like aldo/keto reductase
MAYSPIEQGRLLGHSALQRLASKYEAPAAHIALAWVLRQPGMIAIPKASSSEHVQENRAALNIHLTDDDLKLLDREFPRPAEPIPLESL